MIKMDKVWVIYHNETGKEWFVSRYRRVMQVMMWFAPKHHTWSWYQAETYKDYKGRIF